MKKTSLSFMITAGILGGIFTFSVSPHLAGAFDLSGTLGAVIGGAQQYRQIDAYMDHINNTDDGRNEYFQALIKDLGVSDNDYYARLLDDIMGRLTQGIGASDPSIYNKPYLYFLNADQTFNASCGLGHVMTVNEGIFNLSENIDEIAVVIAHEMGHGQKDHVLHGTRKKLKTAIGGTILAGAIGGSAFSDKAMGVLTQHINNVQITKKAEWEADNLAFDYCYQAGYNPGAGAALWERVIEKKGDTAGNFIGEIFSPNDHPGHKERRDNYEKKISALSGGRVTIKNNSDVVQINKKDFLKPAPLADMSSTERKYLVMGNLAAAYDHGQNIYDAYVQNGTVMLGNQAIFTPVSGDISAEEAVAILNRIK